MRIALSPFAHWIVKLTVFEVPPPGAGFVTPTLTVPEAAMSAAGMSATSCDPPINAVATGMPFHSTAEVSTKPEPFTVSSKSAPPEAVRDGESPETPGVGLLGPAIGKLMDCDAITSPGVFTATLPDPGCAISSWLIAAVT